MYELYFKIDSIILLCQNLGVRYLNTLRKLGLLAFVFFKLTGSLLPVISSDQTKFHHSYLMKLKLHSFSLFAVALLFFFFTGRTFVHAQAEFTFGATATYMNIANGISGTQIYFVVGNPATNGITGASATKGWIISEGQWNNVKWLGTTATSYVFPFGYSNTDYLPFTFNATGGSAAGDLTVSTWHTNQQNQPEAAATDVGAVTGMVDQATGTDESVGPNYYVIDRWWTIYGVSGTAVATLSFTYRGQENTNTNPTDEVGI